ncbi:MAG TPA: CvpA family protein [Flavipsychrobacter sp.]|nr:CvpA family protein [Flavipsychrobacter sp.]
MLLDIIGITLVIILFIRGYRKGIIVAAFSLLGFILGIICALKLSHTFASWLFDKGIITSGWAQVVSFIVLFIVVVLLVRLLAKAIDSVVNAVFLGFISRLLGGLFYAFIAAVIWSTLLWIANQMHLISPETIAHSKTYSWFTPVAPWVCDHVGKVLPFAKHIFSDLQHFFENVNQKLPQHVGPHR